jgi:hypothetical protein
MKRSALIVRVEVQEWRVESGLLRAQPIVDQPLASIRDNKKAVDGVPLGPGGVGVIGWRGV